MKKRIPFLWITLLSALLLSACGSATESSKGVSVNQSTADYAAPAEDSWEASAEYAPASVEENGIAASAAAGADGAGSLQAEKIIYSASAKIETTDYEKALEGVYVLVERFGGFVERSSISGSNYYYSSRGLPANRSADFTLRIPSENFKALTSSLTELGNVPYCDTSSENVTARYYDTESRLTAYRTQESRLMEMLEAAKTVEDMLAIQQQLTDVQYEIDTLQSTLTNYDRQISYSTVSLNVQEVEEYTPQPDATLSYWEKMGRGFLRSLETVGSFFKSLLLWLVSNLPVLLLVALAIFALVKLLLARLHKAASENAPVRRWAARRGSRKRKDPEDGASS